MADLSGADLPPILAYPERAGKPTAPPHKNRTAVDGRLVQHQFQSVPELARSGIACQLGFI